MGLENINFAHLLIGFMALLVSLSIHEAAHALSAKWFGDNTAYLEGRVSLNPIRHIDLIGTVIFPLVGMISGAPLIGWAKPVPVNGNNLRDPKLDNSFIAAAGPISNIIQAILFTILLVIVIKAIGNTSSVVFDYIKLFFISLVTINIALAIFNLIPIPPLDGGWVLSGLLPDSVGDLFNKIGFFGIILIWLLMVPIGKFIISPAINGYIEFINKLL